MSNQTGRWLEVTVTVATADGTAVVDDSLSVGPATEIESTGSISPGSNPENRTATTALSCLEVASELRSDELSIALAEGHATTETVAVGPWFPCYWVQVTDDDLLLETVRDRDEFFSETTGDSDAGVHTACHQPPTGGWPERATGSTW